MARIRKDKAEKARVAASSSSTKRKHAARDVLRKNIIALGGTDADMDLIHDIGDGEQPLHGDGKQDAGLAKDVTKFLKELNFPNGDDVPASQPQDAPAKAKKSKTKKETVEDVRTTVAAPAKSTAKKQQQQQQQPKKKADPKPSPSTSTPAAPAAPAAPLPTPSSTATTLPPPPKNPKLLVQPTPDWYALVPPLSPPASAPVPVPTATQIASLAKHAGDLHAAELAGFASSPNAALLSSSSDHAFLKTILASGTLSDRLSALTLMVQSSPLHNTRGLDVLKGMAERGRGGGGAKDGKGGGGGGGRDERLKAARAIVDWWVGGGAPARKLKYFRDQPLLHPDVTDRHLLVWYFEDWLKKYFFALLQTLEALSLDTLAYVRTQALSLIFNLLREKPEQEHNLLRLLVNKLGDGEKSVCSRASYHILQLLQTHPVMKSIVIRETTALVMRPVGSSAAVSSLTATPAAKPRTHIRFDDDVGDHKTPKSDAAPQGQKSKANAKAKAKAQQPEKSAWNLHARYYAAITFNQVVLSTSEEDRKAARMLMDVYFQIFREVVGERSVPEPADDAPGAHDGDGDKDKAGDAEAEAEVGKRGKREYGKGKAKAGPRAKEVQGAAGFAEVQDSNSRLVSAILTGVNRAMPFARFGGADVEFQRHMDTLFLITHTSTFNIALQALTLIQHILASLSSAPSTSSAADAASAAAAVAVRYFRTLYNTLLDFRLYESSKQAMYLNLLFKSVKSDADPERVRAFVKRFCQVLVGGFGGAEFVAGGLWLLGELFNTEPGLRSMIDKPAPAAASSTDGEAQKYDPRKRDPQYAHASASPLWELLPLVHHAHPTISLLARQLLARRPLTTSPDLALHTLAHFLDRFVFKNPKKARAKGSSAMQPSAAAVGGEGDGVRRVRGEAQEAPVNEDGWWRRGVGSVPADQMFFHQYFSQKHEREKAKAAKAGKRKHRKDDSDAEEASEEEGDDEEEEEEEEAGAEHGGVGVDEDEEDSDADEAEIWKAMKASMPELKGGDVDDDLMEDSDELPSGLDEDSEDGSGAELEDDEDDEDGDEDMAGAVRASDDDAFSLVEASDAEDLLDLDEVNPTGLVEYDGSDAGSTPEEEWAGFGDGASAVAGGGKRKRAAEGEGEGEGKGKSQRKKRRSLPTFASYEDYAKMIEDGPEDNV